VLVPGGPARAIAPYPTAPACATHDPTAFHTLWNAADGCHYDHEHGEPYPAWAQAAFGDYTDWTGQAISYPWQTPNENVLKHAGYKLFHKDFRTGAPYSQDYAENPANDPCPAFVGSQDPTPNAPNRTLIRVVAYSLQTHNLAHAKEAMTRKHSYWAMLLVCDPATNTFGTIQTGGHADFGQRVSPYQGALLPLPDQPQPSYTPSREPYLAHPCADPECGRFPVSQNTKSANNATWTAEPVNVVGANKIVNFTFHIRNAFDGIADRFGTPHGLYRCTHDGGATFHQPGCYSVGTQHNFISLRGHGAPASLDTDGDGLVSFLGFTDLQGNVDPECTDASATCVPLVLDTVPLGSLIGDDQTRAFGHEPFDAAIFTQRNVCFDAADGLCNCEAADCIPAGWIGKEN
jgi:hypothetical protein